MYLTDQNEKKLATTTEFLLDNLLSYCEERGYALAVWRLPASAQTHVLIANQVRVFQEEAIEDLSSGFLVGAFRSVLDKKKFFLPADHYFQFGEGEQAAFMDSLSNRLPDFLSFEKKEKREQPSIALREQKENFAGIVQEAIGQMVEGTVKKIVLARRKKLELSKGFSFHVLWKKMASEFPNTFNSVVYLPEMGIWAGASPEVLVSQDAEGIFRTIALAGTQKALDKTEREAVWTQKEIEEQAYVRRYIIDCLKFIRLREFEDIGPKTVRVGHLFHLRTDFIVDTKEVNFPNLLSTLLGLLHPTAAVCGTPKEKALEFILQKEGFDRELYGGFLGPVNIAKESHLFVNLRCAKFEEGMATLFAGAGIIQDSIPEQELAETETKMDSLRQLF